MRPMPETRRAECFGHAFSIHSAYLLIKSQSEEQESKMKYMNCDYLLRPVGILPSRADYALKGKGKVVFILKWYVSCLKKWLKLL